MPRYNDLNDNDPHMETQAVSSNRPPQFNAVNCGFRCGWGCCEPQGGDDEDGGGRAVGTDATPTSIDSKDENQELDEPLRHEDFQESDPAGPSAHVLEDGESDSTIVFDDLDESLQFHEHLTAVEYLSNASTGGWVHGDFLNRFQDEISTRSQFNAAYDAGSIGNVSRNGYFAGIGAWFEDDQASAFPGFFCQTPLRLSHEYEDCRGHPMSHMTTQDYSTLLGPVGYAWSIQRAAIGYALYRDAE